jgi:hypothetical protein
MRFEHGPRDRVGIVAKFGRASPPQSQLQTADFGVAAIAAQKPVISEEIRTRRRRPPPSHPILPIVYFCS